ncbi:MAG: S8 family serine peptidase [Chitinophagaceae bacterium]|nr:S8 family serine peptidase [Chitinophagaceae bacterium]
MMKKLMLLSLQMMFFTFFAFAQTREAAPLQKDTVPNNWYQLDPATSGFQGVSIDKAYSFLKSTKLKSKKVIVAVIDSGIDTTHEDLKPVLWTNPGEIAGNGIDDDKNGYVDDVHGWNFLGGKDGRNVKDDSYEASRVYHLLKAKYGDKTIDVATLSADDKAEYETYLRAKESVTKNVDENEIAFMKQIRTPLLQGDSVIRKELGKEVYTCNDLKNYKTTNKAALQTRSMLMGLCGANKSDDLSNEMVLDDLNAQIRKGDEVNTAPPAYRGNIVKDNENDINDRFYGNNDLMASTPFHGSFCAGIIAAAHNNNDKLNGIADNVEIMAIRAVPNGDEHDKDIALAIKYAVDNGAKVINMSFGKSFSPQKKWVDDAIRYANSKGVLLVHAAGNDSKNIDTENNFPNPVYADNSGRAENYISVGASGDKKSGGLIASFSNYGKKEVDVFAPGVQIFSTTPFNNSYGKSQGTSFAAPIVTGIAALILEYYPSLSPLQVKAAIENSVAPIKEKVKNPETGEMVEMETLSRTGGVVNAYTAVKNASEMAATPNPQFKLPKSTIKKNKKG